MAHTHLIEANEIEKFVVYAALHEIVKAPCAKPKAVAKFPANSPLVTMTG